MEEQTLAPLLSFTRDGEWGNGEPTDGFSPAFVIRGTDFARVRSGDLSNLPLRFIRTDILGRKRIIPGDTLIETAGGTKDQPTGRTVFMPLKIVEASSLPLICASFARFLRPNPSEVVPAFLFWKLQDEYHSMRMLPYHIQHTGVARFQYTQFAENYRMEMPPLPEQRSIAATLGALDDKIELNRRMCETLESMARALFRDWFVDFGPTRAKMAGDAPYLAEDLWSLFPDRLDDDGKPEGWHFACVGDYLVVKRGGSPRPIQDYIGQVGYPWVKIADATALTTPFLFATKERIKTSGLNKTVKLREGSLILSNSATPGLPIFLQLEACIHDGWLYFPDIQKFSLEYLYLQFQEMRTALVGKGNGSVFTNLKTEIVKNHIIIDPTESALRVFDKAIEPIFSKIRTLSIESRTLAETRDMLLPRLMSGELLVAKADRLLEEVL